MHCLFKASNIDHAVGIAVVTYANLFNAPAYGLHRLEVIRSQSALNPIQLEACLLPCPRRETANHIQAIASERYAPHRDKAISFLI